MEGRKEMKGGRRRKEEEKKPRPKIKEGREQGLG